MRALTVAALSDDLSGVALVESPEPERRLGQLLVRVRASALNYPDLLMTRGLYQLKPPLPFTLGMEVAGEVIDCDPDSGFASGDRVAAGTRLGAFADLVAVDACAARPLPLSMGFVEGAALGVAYLTAYVALIRLGRMAEGEWVLVHGATGGVGLAALDLGRALGAKVIATSRAPTKLDLIAEEYAPDAIFIAPGFRERVKEITGGGADLVFDPVGGDVFDESTRAIAFGGRLLVVGFTSGRIASVPANIPLIKGFSVVGLRAGEYGRRFPALGAENLDAIWSLAAGGRIRPRVHATFPLADWRAAFETMTRAEHVGKLVLIP